jgi:PBP1b-binding outer membrane lipoprotein LpoB
MARYCWLIAIAVSLAACSQRPEEKPPPPQTAPATTQSTETSQNTELRDAVQAPLEQAEDVQQTLDERAAQMRATLESESEGDEPDDPTKKKDDEEDGEE